MDHDAYAIIRYGLMVLIPSANTIQSYVVYGNFLGYFMMVGKFGGKGPGLGVNHALLWT